MPKFSRPRLLVLLIVSVLLIAVTHAQTTVFTDPASGTRYTVTPIMDANFPVGMVYAQDGRLFYTEKTTGNIRVILPDGTRPLQPVITLPTDALQERGTLGIAVSPTFEQDNWLYVMHTAAGTARDFPANRLVRFVVSDENRGSSLQELLRVPITNGLLLHNGGNVHFDRDGYLYVSLGDYGEAANAQDVTTPQGAIHRFRVTEAGLEPAPDNPFADNSIYAYGLRNPFDYTFDPFSEHIFVGEVGPSCDDEVNVITAAGQNFGWIADYDCVGMDGIIDVADYVPPLLSFTPVISPTGILVYDGDAFPEWQGDLFLCAWNTGTLRRIELDETRTQAVAVHELALGDSGCRLDLVIAPDGSLVFGTVGTGEALIMRLSPAFDDDTTREN